MENQLEMLTCISELDQLKTSDYCTALIHLYRGELNRQVAYRARLDVTTNFAVSSTAGLSILSLSQSVIPHYFHLLIALLLLIFCVMESRRYVYYSVIQYRVRQLEKGFFSIVVLCESHDSSTAVVDQVQPSDHLATLRSSLNHPKAGRRSFYHSMLTRFRRIYYPLLTAVYAGWLLKLQLTADELSTPVYLFFAVFIGVICIVIGLSLYMPVLSCYRRPATVRGILDSVSPPELGPTPVQLGHELDI